MKFISDIRLLLLGIWIGAAVFFIGVAQTSFHVLPERELAGAVVNRTLAILNYGGLSIGIILLISSLIVRKGSNLFLLWTERFLLLVMIAACAVGQFVIAWWMYLIRQQIGKPIDEVAADDPLRLQFNAMHEYSVWVLFVGMVAAFIAFFLIANRRTAKEEPVSPLEQIDFQKEFKI